MRILSARIFLSLLAGKFQIFEQRLPWKQKANFDITAMNKIFNFALLNTFLLNM